MSRNKKPATGRGLMNQSSNSPVTNNFNVPEVA